jgi:hypothetical protein
MYEDSGSNRTSGTPAAAIPAREPRRGGRSGSRPPGTAGPRPIRPGAAASLSDRPVLVSPVVRPAGSPGPLWVRRAGVSRLGVLVSAPAVGVGSPGRTAPPEVPGGAVPPGGSVRAVAPPELAVRAWPGRSPDRPVSDGGMPDRQHRDGRPAPGPATRPGPSRLRTLDRRPATGVAGALRRRLAGVLAGVAVAALAATLVVGWGLLLAAGPPGSGSTGSAPVAARAGELLVEVDGEPTLWDLARRLRPGADGPRLADMAERIAVRNGLTSVELRPGQVLLVPAD